MIAAIIEFVLANFTLTFFVLGLLAAWIACARKPKPLGAAVVVEALFAYFLLFSIGLANLYNFVLHVFFGATTAQFIGWAQSPFQAEVGFASLGFGVVGLLAFRGSYGMRVGAIVAPACFLLGDAVGHVNQMVAADNFAPGNAGIIFYTDIVIPIVGFLLLWLKNRFSETKKVFNRQVRAAP